MTITADTGAPAPAAEFFKTEITPENLFLALGKLRREAFDEIERLLHFLDECDGDEDLEPSLGYQPGGSDDREAEPEHDEPTLGTFDQMLNQTNSSKTYGEHMVDAEIDHSDDEPSLGSLLDQTKWAQGGRDDREGDGCADDREGDEEEHGGDEHDGAEPEEQEPSLGSVDPINQERWAQGSTVFADGELQDHAPAPTKPRGKPLPTAIKLERYGYGRRSMILNHTQVQADVLAPRIAAGPRHFARHSLRANSIVLGSVKE